VGRPVRYRLFGANVAVHDGLTLRANPCTDGTAVDLDIRVVAEPPAAPWGAAEQRYTTPPPAGRSDPDFVFLRLPDRDVIRIGASADVHVLDHELVFHLKNPASRFLVETVVLGLGMAFWLERRGRATLHGSAIEIDGHGVAFVAKGGTGKSSMAAHLTASGDGLVTEDLLSIVWRDGAPTAETGVAQLRLWPEVAAQLVDDWSSLEQPHPAFEKRKLPVGPDGVGRFAEGAVPLRRIYALQRTTRAGYPPTVIPISAADGLSELLVHSYLPEMAEHFGWQGARLPQLARLVAASPVRVLRYRAGVEHFPRIREAIVEDLAAG
jgi:hypothetical protein